MDEKLEAMAREAEKELRAMASAERREVTSGYLPTSMELLGVPVPNIRKVIRRLNRELKGQAPERVVDLARALKDGGTHEGRQAAYELLERRKDARSLLKTREIRALGKGNDNWASVDAFSVCVSGPAWREGQVSDTEVYRWARSKDRWWRRTALVSTVALNLPSRGGTGDPERTLALCEAMAWDTDPMVAKGLSWALRTAIAHDKAGVRAFMKRHGEALPALVRREVRNKLETGKKNPRL